MGSAFRLFLSLILLLAGAASNAAPYGPDWHDQFAAARRLAEVDTRRAHDEARRLEKSLADDAAPSDRVRLLNLLARIETYRGEVDRAIGHAAAAAELAEDQGYREGQLEAQLILNLNAISGARLDFAAAAATQALELVDDATRPDLLGETLLLAAMSHHRFGQLDDAIELAMRAQGIAVRSGDSRAQAYAHWALGTLMSLYKNAERAHEHWRQMREDARTSGSRILEVIALTGQSRAMSALGDIDGAERALKEAAAMAEAVGAPFCITQVLQAKADIAMAAGRHGEALRLLDQAVAIYGHHPNPIGLWYALKARGVAQEALGRLAAARIDLKRALDLASKIGAPAYISESLRRIAANAADRGDYAQAYRLAAQASDQADDAAMEHSGKRIVELTRKYEADSARREIDALEQRNRQQADALRQQDFQRRWLWTLLGASVLMLAGSVFFFQRLRAAYRKLSAASAQTGMLSLALDCVREAVYLSDRDGCIRYVNAEACRALGFSRHDLLSMKISDIDAKGRFDELNRIDQHVDDARFQVFDRHHRTKDGEVFPVEIFAAAAEYRGDGVAISLARDITDRRRLEEALERREREFRTLAENSPDCIIRYDRDGCAIYINPQIEETLGVPAPALLGRRPAASFSDGSFDAYQIALFQVLASGVQTDCELERPDGTGGWRYYQVRMVPEKNERGDVIGALAVGRNITAIKQTELALEASRAALRRLAAHGESTREEERRRIAREVHDELGQILTGLQMNVARLIRQFGATAPHLHERLEETASLTGMALQVARNIVAVLRPPVLDMGIVVALEWLAESFAANAGVHCEAHLDADDAGLDESDAAVIYRVVQESLTNVARHAGADRVDIWLDREADAYRLRVWDNGVGFDVNAVGAKSFGLLGMRERILMLNGTLEVDSKPGRGTRLTARIPVRV